LDAKIDAAIAAVDIKFDTTAANIEKLEKLVNDFKEETAAAAATEVEIAASWQFLANSILSTNNRNAVAIRVGGKNIEQYDYTPLVAPFFECAYQASSPGYYITYIRTLFVLCDIIIAVIIARHSSASSQSRAVGRAAELTRPPCQL
jgi:hypothetical protein